MREICAGYNESGQRLDKLIRKVLPNANDSFIYKMLRKKNITLNDKKASGSETVQEGDVVRIWFSDETYAKFAGESADGGGVDGGLDLQHAFDKAIIYEDRDILVINKPAGMLSQKAAQDDISVVELLTDNLLSRGEITREQLKTFHPSICNRLDRNTSGVLVCGKSLHGLQDMSELIRGRSVRKDYLAVVCGEVRQGQHIKAYLVKDHAGNKVKILDRLPNEGKPEAGNSESVKARKKKNDEYRADRTDAEFIDTEFRPVYTNGDVSLIMVRIHTGKTHQIRAQMAALGHPLCGDVKYGKATAGSAELKCEGLHAGEDKGGGRSCRKKADCRTYPRQLLHACSLALPDGRRFIAPVPEDVKAAVGGYEWGHGRPADFEDLPLKI